MLEKPYVFRGKRVQQSGLKRSTRRSAIWKGALVGFAQPNRANFSWFRPIGTQLKEVLACEGQTWCGFGQVSCFCWRL